MELIKRVRRCDVCQSLINMGELNIRMIENGKIRHVHDCKKEKHVKKEPRQFEML